MMVVDVRIASVYYLWPQRVAFGNFTTHQISSPALRFALSAHATSTLASSVSNVSDIFTDCRIPFGNRCELRLI